MTLQFLKLHGTCSLQSAGLDAIIFHARWWVAHKAAAHHCHCLTWTVRILCDQVHAASGAMWKERQAQPCVGRNSRSDAACSVSSAALRMREGVGLFLLLFYYLSVDFSSHLLSKMATTGVSSPSPSSWSCWATLCVCANVCARSQTVCFLKMTT